MYREIERYNEVIKNLSEMAIWEGERKACFVEDDWLDRIRNINMLN